MATPLQTASSDERPKWSLQQVNAIRTSAQITTSVCLQEILQLDILKFTDDNNEISVSGCQVVCPHLAKMRIRLTPKYLYNCVSYSFK